MITPTHLQTFDRPYFNIAQIKTFQPEQLDNIKALYKQHHQDWQHFVLIIFQQLNHYPIAKPHIESWCNGWQVRKHFFAYFKYQQWITNAPIISLILNRKRLIVHLDWHAYKATQSKSTLKDFNNWLNNITPNQQQHLADLGFYFWSNQVSEYDEFTPMQAFDEPLLPDNGWYKIGRFIEKDDLANVNDEQLCEWTINTIEQLLIIYEHCHGKLP